MIDLLFPDGHLIVGLVDDADGSLRVLLDHASTGIHTHVDDKAVQQELRERWAGTTVLTTRIPRDALCDCPRDEAVAS